MLFVRSPFSYRVFRLQVTIVFIALLRIASLIVFVSVHIALDVTCCYSIKVRFLRVNGVCDFTAF